MADDMKSNEASVREFVISTSRIPFVRAGWSNLGLAFMGAFAFLSNRAAIEFELGHGMSLVVGATVGILFFAIYTRSVSRIVIENSSMQFICAIHRESLHVPSIKRIKVLELNLSSWIIIVVSLDNKVLPRVFHYSRMIYPTGTDLHITATNLREFLKRTGTNEL